MTRGETQQLWDCARSILRVPSCCASVHIPQRTHIAGRPTLTDLLVLRTLYCVVQVCTTTLINQRARRHAAARPPGPKLNATTAHTRPPNGNNVQGRCSMDTERLSTPPTHAAKLQPAQRNARTAVCALRDLRRVYPHEVEVAPAAHTDVRTWSGSNVLRHPTATMMGRRRRGHAPQLPTAHVRARVAFGVTAGPRPHAKSVVPAAYRALRTQNGNNVLRHPAAMMMGRGMLHGLATGPPSACTGARAAPRIAARHSHPHATSIAPAAHTAI